MGPRGGTGQAKPEFDSGDPRFLYYASDANRLWGRNLCASGTQPVFTPAVALINAHRAPGTAGQSSGTPPSTGLTPKP